MGICYQKLQGDRVIELRVQTTNSQGHKIFDTVLKTIGRSNIQSADEIQFLAKAHELSDGRVVVVWIEANSQKISRKIYAKVIDSNGRINDKEFLIQTDNGFGISDIHIDKVAATKFAITWTSIGGQDGDGRGTYGQAINIEGSGSNSTIELVGEGGLINTITAGDQINKGLQELGNNRAVFFWADENGGLQARVLQKKTNVSEEDAASQKSYIINESEQTIASGMIYGSGLSSAGPVSSGYSGNKKVTGIESYEDVSAKNMAEYEAIQRELKNAKDEKERQLTEQAKKEAEFLEARERELAAQELYEIESQRAQQEKLNIMSQLEAMDEWEKIENVSGKCRG